MDDGIEARNQGNTRHPGRDTQSFQKAVKVVRSVRACRGVQIGAAKPSSRLAGQPNHRLPASQWTSVDATLMHDFAT
jgi:hypothetical protein